MYPKHLEETIQSLQTKKQELEKQAEDLHQQLKTVSDQLSSIKKKFETIVTTTHATTQLYDRILKECRNELALKSNNENNSIEKKKPFALSDIREKILEKKLPKNASISQLASQLAPARKQ